MTSLAIVLIAAFIAWKVYQNYMVIPPVKYAQGEAVWLTVREEYMPTLSTRAIVVDVSSDHYFVRSEEGFRPTIRAVHFRSADGCLALRTEPVSAPPTEQADGN